MKKIECSHECRLQSTRISPSSWMVITSCHYSPTDFISSWWWVYVSLQLSIPTSKQTFIQKYGCLEAMVRESQASTQKTYQHTHTHAHTCMLQWLTLKVVINKYACSGWGHQASLANLSFSNPLWQWPLAAMCTSALPTMHNSLHNNASTHSTKNRRQIKKSIQKRD
jgi:hypothetical protein